MMHDIIVRNGYGEDSFPGADFLIEGGDLHVLKPRAEGSTADTIAVFAKGQWSAVIRAERETAEPWGPATTIDGSEFSAVDGECVRA